MPTDLSVHVPALRRYARASTGSQPKGDDLVLATLQSVATDPGFTGDSRLELYRRFCTVDNEIATHEKQAAQTEGTARGPDRRLAGLSPVCRKAFLLVAVEGFTHAEAARILDQSLDEFETVLARARREIAAQVTTDVLIIEDEVFIATDLERIMIQLGHRVIGIERTHRDALAAVEQARPGLVLADIQLADGSSGIEAVNEMLAKAPVPVVFITAYPDRWLTGLRPEPTFLIIKPFQVASVRAVVSQALFFETSAHPATPPRPRH